MEVKFEIRGVEELQRFLRDLPKGTVKVAIEALGEWFIGTDRRGLRHPPPYRYVSRKRAYGASFVSEKQRKWFWANGGPDMIGDNRTGETNNSWESHITKGGYSLSLQNRSKGAYYTMSDTGQARQPALAGWRKVSDIVSTNMAGAIRHAKAAIRALMGRR